MEPGGKSHRSFDWAPLVACVIHPAKVAIVEAMLWIEEPLSASAITAMHSDDEHSLGVVSYHLKELAKLDVIAKVSEMPRRGASEKFYFLTR